MERQSNGLRHSSPGGVSTHSMRCGVFGCVLGISLWAPPVLADQFILFDATFDYTWEDANNSSPSKSHYYVTDSNFMNLERPSDWVSPVNYRDGSVHIRVEVFEKPAGGQSVGWALCYIANQGSYGCPYSDYYTQEGVYDRDVAMSNFWKSGPITWEAGIKQMDLVYTINNSGSGHVHNFPELASATTPTSVRITMVQVSAGDTYDPSILDESSGTGGSEAGAGGSWSGGETQVGGTAGQVGTGGFADPGGGNTTGGTSDGSTTEDPAGDDDSNDFSRKSGGGCSLTSRELGENELPAALVTLIGLFGFLRHRRRERPSHGA